MTGAQRLRAAPAAEDGTLSHFVLVVLQHVAGLRGQAGTWEKTFFIIQAMTAWLSVSQSPDQITNLTDRLLSTRQLANANLANIEAEC